jgi:hypothetical protein
LLVPTVVHWPVARSSVRVTLSGPASNSLPFGSTNMNGYSGILRDALGIDVQLFVAGL